MDLGLEDRVAIVGGSSSGIGKAAALALARGGASVTISGRDEAELRKAEIEIARVSTQHHVLAMVGRPHTHRGHQACCAWHIQPVYQNRYRREQLRRASQRPPFGTRGRVLGKCDGAEFP